MGVEERVPVLSQPAVEGVWHPERPDPDADAAEGPHRELVLQRALYGEVLDQELPPVADLVAAEGPHDVLAGARVAAGAAGEHAAQGGGQGANGRGIRAGSSTACPDRAAQPRIKRTAEPPAHPGTRGVRLSTGHRNSM